MAAAAVKFPESLKLTAAPFAGVVGIDWADRKHDMCVVLGDGSVGELSVVPHTPKALQQWADELHRRVGGQPVAVCVEQSRCPLINALEQFEFLTMYPVNPHAMSSFRDAFSVSGAKDDRGDAALLARMFLCGQDRLKPLTRETDQTRMLQAMAEGRRKLVDKRTALVNELTALLKSYYPLALEICGANLHSALALDLLEKYPTLEKLRAARPSVLERFFYAHHVRRRESIDQRLTAVRDAKPLTLNAAIIQPAQMHLAALRGQLREITKSIASYDHALAQNLENHPDAFIFKSLPGAGPINAVRLLVAFGTCRVRWPHAQALQNYSGVAPVQRCSGNSKSVQKRRSVPDFVHQTFYEFAGSSIRYCTWARDYYHRQRKQGRSHASTLRKLAFKWIRIIWRMWHNGEAYDEQRYLDARLARIASPAA